MQTSLPSIGANSLARKGRRISRVRSLGEQVQEFLDGEGITAAQLAKQLGESRQNLENLVAGRAGMPKYLLALSMAMRASADELLAGRYRYRARGTPAAAAPGSSYVVEVWPFTRLTREEWAELSGAGNRRPAVRALRALRPHDRQASLRPVPRVRVRLRAVSPESPA